MGIVEKVRLKFMSERDALPSFSEIVEFVNSEPQSGTPGEINWILRQRTDVDPGNTGEVSLERAIVRSFQSDNTWFNQIPICSGIFEIQGDKRACLDLVHKVSERHPEFNNEVQHLAV